MGDGGAPGTGTGSAAAAAAAAAAGCCWLHVLAFAGLGRFRPSRVPCLKGEITALVMPTNGVTNGPCNTSNPSHITAWLGHTAALTLSCVSPGQDAGVAPPGRRLPAPLPPRQGNRPSFYPVLPTPREARIGETQIPFGGSRSHCAAAQPAAGRHQLNTPRAAAAA